MKQKSIILENGFSRAALIGLCAVSIALALIFAKWAFGHAIALNADVPEVAALGTQLAPADGHAHFAYASLLEKTLLPADQINSLREVETAISLAPEHYVYWLALGRAREQSGDPEGAEQALRKARELAPNYARVQWALGNTLLRQGRLEEAFAEIRGAVAADASFSTPAASAAWQIFAGDIQRIGNTIGNSPRINGSVAVLLASERRYAEAADVWRRISEDERREILKEPGQLLMGKFIDAGKYQSAIEVANGTGLFPRGEVAAGTISNGGFESSLTPQPVNMFSWTIGDGLYPRVGLNEAQKRSGSYSLLMNFGQGGKGFRPVFQRVGVEPSGRYELRFYYRSELKTEARVRSDVVSAGEGSSIAGTILQPKPDWTEMRVPFTVPPEVEGVEVKIGIDGCAADGCLVTGNIWFDDFSLAKSE